MHNSLYFFSFNTKHLQKPHDWQFCEFQVHECPVWWDGIERTTFTKFTTLRQHFSLRFAFQRTAKCVLVFVQGVSHFPPYPLHPEQYPMHEHHAGLSPIVHDLTPNCWHSWAFYGTRESTMREKECVKGGQKEASEITRPGWLNYGRKKANQEEARIALMARLLFLSAVNCYCFWGITVFMELASSFYPSFFLSFSVIHLPSFDTLKLLEEALFVCLFFYGHGTYRIRKYSMSKYFDLAVAHSKVVWVFSILSRDIPSYPVHFTSKIWNLFVL